MATADPGDARALRDVPRHALRGRFRRILEATQSCLDDDAGVDAGRADVEGLRSEFVHPEDRRRTLRARSALAESVPLHALTNRYLCKDGTCRWLQWKSVSNAARGLVYAIARDVTGERNARETQERLQRQLMIADRMASVGILAGGVAHEINNPLASVTLANLGLIVEEDPTRWTAAPILRGWRSGRTWRSRRGGGPKGSQDRSRAHDVLGSGERAPGSPRPSCQRSSCPSNTSDSSTRSSTGRAS